MKLNKWICALVLALALCMMGSVALAVTNTMPAPVNGVITLTEDVELDAYYAVNSDTILNLNGHTISRSASYPTDSTAGNLTVFGPATLTINGPGTVNSADVDNSKSQIAVWAYNGGKVIINGGTFTNQDCAPTKLGELIYASEMGSQITINGGTFKGSSLNYVLNLRDNTGANIVVNGGTFSGFVAYTRDEKPYDPSQAKSEPGNKTTNYVNPEAKVVIMNGVAVVIPPSYSAPKTGDNSNVMLWAGLMLVSVLGMAMVAKKRVIER